MARTTTAKNQMGTFNSQGGQAFGGAQSDLGQYNKNLQTLEAGKNVGANPFQSTAYLSNVNKLQSEGLNTAADSGKANLQRWSRATGGLNSAQVPLAMRDQTLQTGRLADTLSAERAASDYKSNLAWQQYLTGAPLAGAQIQSGIYGTATGGAGNALNNYTTSQNDVYDNLTKLGQAAISGGSSCRGPRRSRRVAGLPKRSMASMIHVRTYCGHG